MDTQDPQVSKLVEKIERLSRGEAILFGGTPDVNYLREQIDQLNLPQETISSLVSMLDEVDPELSTWEVRKSRELTLSDDYFKRSREAYVKRFYIERRVVDLLGLEVLRESKVLYSNYYDYGPFIAILPESTPPEKVIRLTEMGYEPMTLERNEALALFIGRRRRLRAEKLQQDPRCLDKKIADFMGGEAGNDGVMFFLGPPCDYTEEIEETLSPSIVMAYSMWMGFSPERRVTNLIGAMPEGATVYVKETTIFVLPNAQSSNVSQ